MSATTRVILCALALVSPKRSAHIVGQSRIQYSIYRTTDTEYCFEEAVVVGKTVWNDELLWQREVPMEKCQ